jgi:hypothetical protein
MANIFEVTELWGELDIKVISSNIIKGHKEEVTDIQRSQLYHGKTNEGLDIRPFYSEDPYFKKPGAAQRYAAWKQKITPDPLRGEDVPNLFIVGKFYQSIKGKDIITGITMVTSGSFASRIVSKFSNVLGLNEDSTEIYIDKYHKEPFFKDLREAVGLD